MTDFISTTTVSTPAGPLALLVHDDVLVAAGFTPAAEQYERLHTTTPLRQVDSMGQFSRALSAYVNGDVSALDPLPVEQPGGPFRQAAWKLMRGDSSRMNRATSSLILGSRSLTRRTRKPIASASLDSKGQPRKLEPLTAGIQPSNWVALGPIPFN